MQVSDVGRSGGGGDAMAHDGTMGPHGGPRNQQGGRGPMLPVMGTHRVLGIDPVCGMEVVERPGAISRTHEGRDYFFCREQCAARFEADPERYLGKVEARTAPVSPVEGVEYTCPMHPEVRQVGPGSCPKCGMALEPRGAVAGEAANPELVDMRRRLRVSLLFTVPLFIVAMSDLIPGRPLRMLCPAVSCAGWCPATPVVLWAG
jgi:Cu+-exporting ATPase